MGACVRAGAICNTAYAWFTYCIWLQLLTVRHHPQTPTQVEASSARKGIGLVKLMGRQSGFIAMQVGEGPAPLRTAPRWRKHGRTVPPEGLTSALCPEKPLSRAVYSCPYCARTGQGTRGGS